MQEATKADQPDLAIRIIQSCYDPLLADMPLATAEKGVTDCISIIGEFRIMVGANKNTTPEQLEIEAKWLKNNFKTYSVTDIYLAIELFLNNKLDIELTTYVEFAPLFISYVLNSYSRYKKKILMNVAEVAEKRLMQDESDNTAERVQGLRDCVQECAVHAKNDFKERFYNTMVFDMLRKSKRLLLNEATIAAGKKYATDKFLTDRQTEHDRKKQKGTKPLGQAMEMTPAGLFDRPKAERTYAIDYFLKNFFAKTNMKELLKSITEKDLDKK